LSTTESSRRTETEIEARLGRYSSTGFVSGIQQTEFDFLIKTLSAKKEYVMSALKELDYIYESPIPELPVNIWNHSKTIE
jgi:hypothetical protein